jgi:diaminopimelate epimerase
MIPFFKVSGGGNDFLALAEPTETPTEEQIRSWCRRGVSEGADGLFVLRRGVGESGKAGEVAMEYWNSDGLPADLCLNGTRCAAQLAFHLGWAEEAVRVQTAAGGFAARRLDPERVVLAVPVPETPRELEVDAAGGMHPGWSLRVGVPHFVLLWPEALDHAPVATLGPPIRRHATFGSPGTNVNFVRFPERHRMEIRTFERGVEGETLACGTGVLAATAVGLAAGQAALPLRVLTRGGFELMVEEQPAGWSFSGDARIVARGELLAGAGLAPAAPAWE